MNPQQACTVMRSAKFQSKKCKMQGLHWFWPYASFSFIFKYKFQDACEFKMKVNLCKDNKLRNKTDYKNYKTLGKFEDFVNIWQWVWSLSKWENHLLCLNCCFPSPPPYPWKSLTRQAGVPWDASDRKKGEFINEFTIDVILKTD